MDQYRAKQGGHDAQKTFDAQLLSSPPGKSPSGLQPLECFAQRTMLGWSLDDLAMRSGFPTATISEFEAGTRPLSLSARVALQRILRKGSRTRKV